MAKCGNCLTELKFGNTPLLGANLLSGETLCLTCFRNLVKLDWKVNAAQLTLEQVKGKLSHIPIKQSVVEPTTDRILIQLEKIGITKSSGSLIWGRREISELSSILAEDEEIFGIVQGLYNEGLGILVGTNKRLIFVDKKLLYGLRVEDFGLDKISSIQYETGLLFATIKIMASGNLAKIDQVAKSSARAFCESVRAKLSEPKHSIVPAHQQVDIADQLTKLATLKNQGVLTQEEFDGQKKKLLGL